MKLLPLRLLDFGLYNKGRGEAGRRATGSVDGERKRGETGCSWGMNTFRLKKNNNWKQRMNTLNDYLASYEITSEVLHSKHINWPSSRSAVHTVLSCDPYNPPCSPLALLLSHYSGVKLPMQVPRRCSDTTQHPSLSSTSHTHTMSLCGRLEGQIPGYRRMCNMGNDTICSVHMGHCRCGWSASGQRQYYFLWERHLFALKTTFLQIRQ